MRVFECSQLCLLVDIYNARDVEEYILPMAFHLANDHVAQIRQITLRLVWFTLVPLQMCVDDVLWADSSCSVFSCTASY